MKTLIKILLTILFFGCLIDFPYGYYQFVRFAALVGFGYLAFKANEQGYRNEAFVYLALAILFQPFIKIQNRYYIVQHGRIKTLQGYSIVVRSVCHFYNFEFSRKKHF